MTGAFFFLKSTTLLLTIVEKNMDDLKVLALKMLISLTF